MATIKEVISNLSVVLQNKGVENKEINGVIQFEISGDEPMAFFAKFDDGHLSGGEGTADNPNITVAITSQDFKGLVEGKLDGMAAFASGRLKIRGDMFLAMKLEKMIRGIFG